jgi:peptide/nickel transport system substrate-binding protein
MNKKILNLLLVVMMLAVLVPTTLAAPPAQEGGQDYVVVADDWLSKLADKYLGNPLAYPAIVEYTNQKNAEDASYAKITDPDLIEIGWKIYIPSAEEAAKFVAEAPAEPKTLTVALASFPANLSPGHGGNPALMLLLQFTEGLTRQNPQGELEPALAESWRAIDDTTWEFNLRQGVKFHNGEPFNAQALKFTFERAMDPDRGWPYSRSSRIGPVTSIEVIDDYTVRIKTSRPYPLLPFGTYPIVMEPPGYIQEVGNEVQWQKPIGLGPFKVVEWDPERHLILEANPDYWDGRPKVDRVVIRTIPDPSTRVSALQAGEVDIIDQVPIDLVDLVDSGNTKVMSAKTVIALAIDHNLLEEGPLLNLKVRQAIDYAIDREVIAEGILKGYAPILDGQIITKGAFGYHPDLKAAPYDPEMAKRLLAEAGYADGLKLELSCPVAKYMAGREICLAVGEQLKEVGIDVDVKLMEYAVWSEQRVKRTLKDMHLIGWYNLGDAEFALIWYSTPSGRTYWENEGFDEVFAKARSEMNPTEREKLLHQAMEIMHDEVPAAFLFQIPAIYGVSKDVEGFQPRPDELIGWLYKVDVRR